MTTNGNGANRLGLYASIFMACAVVMSAFIWVGGIAGQVDQDRTQLASLAGRVNGLQGDIRALQIQNAQMERDQREVETQFCASDIVRNLMHANDMRTTAMLWQKTFGSPYPTNNPYYPTICNRPALGQ